MHVTRRRPLTQTGSCVVFNSKMATTKEYSILLGGKNSTFSPSTVGIPMKFIKAVVSHDFDRKIMPEYEKELDILWQKKLKDNPNIYNGSKFRLNSLTEESSLVKLEFGLTYYKDFQCTNMQPKESVKVLQDYGLRNYGDVNACLANPMFSTVIVESSDNYVVMFKRSNMVGESAGMVDFPGGHMEPSVSIGPRCATIKFSLRGNSIFWCLLPHFRNMG